MSTAPAPSASSSLDSPYPSRFRSAPERSRRLGRGLKVMGRITAVDDALLDRIGRAYLETDELGGALADAIRTRAGEPGRVTMTQLRQALAGGVGSVADPPPALAAFCAEVERVPDWVDWDLVEEGGRVYNRFGRNAADVLLQLSLIGGYRFGGPTDLLVATGGLTGDSTRRRLAETQKWATSLAGPGAMRPPAGGRPGGEGWRLTVHVRAMHALVNAAFEPRWDVARWGRPINLADQAATLGLFDGVVLIGCRALGVRIPSEDSAALMHLWRYVGWLMGVPEEFLVDDEWERHRINYHSLLVQADVTEAGPLLSQAILEAQLVRRFPGWPRPLQRVRARFEQERLLSMLTVFLGPTSMRELGLPQRPPWAHAYLLALNTVRYRVIGRTAAGRRHLDRWGERVSRQVLESYFLDERKDVGALPHTEGRG